MLSVLGDVDTDQGRQKEALAIYDKAKPVLVHYKERPDQGALLNRMGGCHLRLNQWNGALLRASRKLLSTAALYVDLIILVMQAY